jgi:predicted enzyme related to lactoylglutathione lyase
MTVQLANITFDCHDAQVVARFWSAALDRPLAAEPPPSAYVALIGGIAHETDGGPNWLFVQVPEGKSAKNRMHVDLVAADRDAEVARLVDLGATYVADHDEWNVRWTVLTDPEGNEFCLAQGDA